MIRTDEIVKVLDFGLAKLTEKRRGDAATQRHGEDDDTLIAASPRPRVSVSPQTEPGMIMGTAAYMSPEQARGKAVDARTDIFSLGVVLYEMLTRRQPFTGETVNHTIVAIMEKQPPPLSDFVKDYPSEIERIIFKSLAKKPDGRYESAKDLLADLKKLQKRLEFEAELGVSQNSFSSAANNPETQVTQILQTPATGEEYSFEGETPPENSIAVLPFSNLSSDLENEYFCDGLAEELLNALAKVGNLKVAARTSAFAFKGKNANVGEIGRTLKVRKILEGSVRKSGRRLRVTAQLVNASDGYHLWSERYDLEMRDIFDVQDNITLAIVDALKLTMLGDTKAAVLKHYTDDAEVYELYLKGLYQYNKYTAEGWHRALGYFEQAIQKQPDYAPAYTAITFCLGYAWYYGVLATDEALPKWRAATNRALEIDPHLAEAHFTLGNINFFYEWDWAEAERCYRRAIELNPNSTDFHQFYGLLLVSRQRFDEAIREGRRALELDPLSLVCNTHLGWIYWHSERFDDALRQVEKLLEIEPNFNGAYWLLGSIYAAQEDYERAAETYQKSLDLEGNQVVLSDLGTIYGLLGRREEAFAVLNELLEMRKHRLVSALNIARVYSGLKENDLAFEWLEKAVEERNGEIVFLEVETKGIKGRAMGESIFTDSRLSDLLRRVGVPRSKK